MMTLTPMMYSIGFAQVKRMARRAEEEVRAGARQLPGTLLNIAIGVVYLELTKQGPTP